MWCGSLGLCCEGQGVPFGLVGQAAVRAVALPGGLCLGLVSSVVPCLWGCAGFCGLGCRDPLRCVGPPPVLSLCLLVVLRPRCRGRVPFSLRCPCRCVRVVVLAVAGVIALRLRCCGGLRGVLGGSLSARSPFSPCGCTLLPLCPAWWLVGATHCGSCGVRSGLRRRVLAGLRLRGSCGVNWVGRWGAAGPSGVACPSFVCVLVPVVAPYHQCHGPWPFLFLALRWFLAPVLRCPLCPVPVGACLLPWPSPRPLAARLPFALSLPDAAAVG